VAADARIHRLTMFRWSALDRLSAGTTGTSLARRHNVGVANPLFTADLRIRIEATLAAAEHVQAIDHSGLIGGIREILVRELLCRSSHRASRSALARSSGNCSTVRFARRACLPSKREQRSRR
jgi:hypothetical protein